MTASIQQLHTLSSCSIVMQVEVVMSLLMVFNFGDIDNMGTGCSGYADYTEMVTYCIPGETYTLTWYTGNMYLQMIMDLD